jgi:hypothetical protein
VKRIEENYERTNLINEFCWNIICFNFKSTFLHFRIEIETRSSALLYCSKDMKDERYLCELSKNLMT